MPPPPILVTDQPLDAATLARQVRGWFGEMVKVVVDVRRRRIAVGGELHADGEARLLEEGSDQQDLWGANYYPGLGPERCVELTALINIRPARGNPGMEITDPVVRESVREITQALLGRGEPL